MKVTNEESLARIVAGDPLVRGGRSTLFWEREKRMKMEKKGQKKRKFQCGCIGPGGRIPGANWGVTGWKVRTSHHTQRRSQAISEGSIPPVPRTDQSASR